MESYVSLHRRTQKLVRRYLGRNGWIYWVDQDRYELVDPQKWEAFQNAAAMAMLLSR